MGGMGKRYPGLFMLFYGPGVSWVLAAGVLRQEAVGWAYKSPFPPIEKPGCPRVRFRLGPYGSARQWRRRRAETNPETAGGRES